MIESVITVKFQTTLPRGVRAALGVSAGDRLAYVIERDRAIIMKARAWDSEDDPAMLSFLAFIERDICDHPERVRELPPALLDRARALIGNTDIDIDASIDGDVAF